MLRDWLFEGNQIALLGRLLLETDEVAIGCRFIRSGLILALAEAEQIRVVGRFGVIVYER